MGPGPAGPTCDAEAFGTSARESGSWRRLNPHVPGASEAFGEGDGRGRGLLGLGSDLQPQCTLRPEAGSVEPGGSGPFPFVLFFRSCNGVTDPLCQGCGGCRPCKQSWGQLRCHYPGLSALLGDGEKWGPQPRRAPRYQSPSWEDVTGAHGEGFQPGRDRRTLTTQVSVPMPAPRPDTRGHTAHLSVVSLQGAGPTPVALGKYQVDVGSGEDGLGPRSHSSQGHEEGVPAPRAPEVPRRR